MTVRALRRRPIVIPALPYRGPEDRARLEAFVVAAHGGAEAVRPEEVVADLSDGVNIYNRLHHQWLRLDPVVWVAAGAELGDVYPLAAEALMAFDVLGDRPGPGDPAASPAWARLGALGP